MISRDEFAAFQQYVKEEFKYLKTMVQDNFKAILKAVSSEENVPDEDVEHGPLHDMEQEAEGGRGPAKSTFLFSNTSRAQRQCIFVDSDEQEISRESHTIPDNMASREGENTSKEINDNEINVENQSHGQAKTLYEEKANKEGDKGQPETNATDAILQPLVEDRCHAPGLDNTEDVASNTKGVGSNLTEQQDQYFSDSQFEIPNELLPSLNPEHLNNERRIVVHPLAYINTPPLEVVGTPVQYRRVRCPGPFTVSPFVDTFGSEIGNNYLIAIRPIE